MLYASVIESTLHTANVLWDLQLQLLQCKQIS